MKKLLFILGLFIAFAASGQNNYTAKAYQSLNADSTTVRGYLTSDSTAGRFTGWIYYNKQSKKWRVGWIDADTLIQWQDLTGAGVSFLDSVKAYNGLTAVGADSVKLGGTLTENTTIDGDANSLSFTDLSTTLLQALEIDLNATGSQLTISNGSGIAAASTAGNISLSAIGGTLDISATASDDITLTGTDETILKNPTSNSVRVQTTGVSIAASDAGDSFTTSSAANTTITAGTTATISAATGATVSTTTSTLTLSTAGTDINMDAANALNINTGNVGLNFDSGKATLTADATPTLTINLSTTDRTRQGGGFVYVEGNGPTFDETIHLDTQGGDPVITIDDTGSDNMTLDLTGITGSMSVFNVTASGGDLRLATIAAGGDDVIIESLDAITGDAVSIDLESTGVSNYTAGGNVNITALSGDDINATASDDINLVAEGGDIINSAAGNFHALATGDVFLSPGSGTGNDLRIVSGANRSMGTAVLVGGTVTVNNTKVTASSNIFLTSQVDGGTPGFVRISARVASTSFTITSSSALDTSTIAWLIIEP